MNHAKSLVCVFCFLIHAGIAGVSQAAEYYVAKNGSNSFSCAMAQSPSTPKLTMNAGAACLAAGDTLHVGAGTYAEAFINPTFSGTSWSNVVRISAVPGASVWMKPSSGSNAVIYLARNQQYIEFDGINLSAANVTSNTVRIEGWSGGNAHHIRIKNAELIGSPSATQNVLASASVAGIVGGNEFLNLTIHGGGVNDFHHALYIQSPNNVVDGCVIYDIPGAGVHLYNGYGLATNNNIVRNNTIRNMRSTVAGQRHWGIVVYSATAGVRVYNNVVHDIPNNGANTSGIEVHSSNVALQNNTVTRVGGKGINIESGSSNYVQNNVSFDNGNNYFDNGNGTVNSSNMIGIDPLFVDPSRGDFRLREGSQAIDRGMQLLTVPTDIFGVQRPQGGAYDIGSHEFTQAGLPMAPTRLRVFSNP